MSRLLRASMPGNYISIIILSTFFYLILNFYLHFNPSKSLFLWNEYFWKFFFWIRWNIPRTIFIGNYLSMFVYGLEGQRYLISLNLVFYIIMIPSFIRVVFFTGNNNDKEYFPRSRPNRVKDPVKREKERLTGERFAGDCCRWLDPIGARHSFLGRWVARDFLASRFTRGRDLHRRSRPILNLNYSIEYENYLLHLLSRHTTQRSNTE